MTCIFCRIISKEIPSQIVYENEKVLAFNDINPAAPQHILVIPKKHIESLHDISGDDADISAAMFAAAKEIAVMKNLPEYGYRIIINNGKAAGQEVFHLHMHILGGKENLGPMLNR
jgi:histidine triad (HIT) family protein